MHLKPILFVLALLVADVSYSQKKQKLVIPTDSLTGLAKYSFEVAIDSVSKQTMYANAKQWIALNYEVPNNLSMVEDADNYKLVGKSMLQVYGRLIGIKIGVGRVHYTFTIQCADNRFQLTVDTIFHENDAPNQGWGGGIENVEPACGTNVLMMRVWNAIRLQSHTYLLALKESLEKDLRGKAVPKRKTEDW